MVALKLVLPYLVGWLVPYAVGLLLGAVEDANLVGSKTESYVDLLHSISAGLVWLIVIGVGALLVVALAGTRVVASALLAAFGGLSAVAAPFIAYELPLGLAALLWQEALALGVILPLTVVGLGKYRSGQG